MPKNPICRFESIEIDPSLIRKYDTAGPRYTLYPVADRFVEEFDAVRYQHAVKASNLVRHGRTISLYIHLPFCETECLYCACNHVVTRDKAQAARYLDFLEREMAMQADLFPGASVHQLHLGGGTPTFLSDAQLMRLMGMLKRTFNFVADARYSVEIDPRRVGQHTLALLASQGFSRMSLGVQDIHPRVQAAVNRILPLESTTRVLQSAAALGFRSINIDLIYGLPCQTIDSFIQTLDTITALRPQRITLYRYTHTPDRIRSQRRIDAATLPGPSDQMAMQIESVKRLLEAGYVYIGLEQFALPDDELALSLRQGRLHYDMQGYATHADSDRVGLGVSAIGKVGNAYSQNHRELEHYYDAIDRGAVPIARGLMLSADDILRRAVIQALLCQGELVFEPFETSWMIDFRRYFGHEWVQLDALAADGLIQLAADAIRITPRGRPLARVVAAVFDKYLREAQLAARYSRII